MLTFSLNTYESSRRRQKDNIKIDVKEMRCEVVD
jgi:hypothetical protein